MSSKFIVIGLEAGNSVLNQMWTLHAAQICSALCIIACHLVHSRPRDYFQIVMMMIMIMMVMILETWHKNFHINSRINKLKR
jgi:hypothetical protein